jgi:hypothetical protein
MSTPQAAEESLTRAQFYAEIVGRYETLDAIGVYSDGTRVICRRNGVARVFLISDLVAVTGQRGSVSLTIPAGASSFNSGLLNFPTPLDNVADWLIFVSTSIGVLGTMLTAIGNIVSTTQFRIFLVRDRINLPVSGTTGIESSGSATGTEQPPNTLLNHQHLLASADDPTAIDHTHPASLTGTADSVGQAAQTATVNWLLVHV